jgi:hypothetical protein
MRVKLVVATCGGRHYQLSISNATKRITAQALLAKYAAGEEYFSSAAVTVQF